MKMATRQTAEQMTIGLTVNGTLYWLKLTTGQEELCQHHHVFQTTASVKGLGFVKCIENLHSLLTKAGSKVLHYIFRRISYKENYKGQGQTTGHEASDLGIVNCF